MPNYFGYIGAPKQRRETRNATFRRFESVYVGLRSTDDVFSRNGITIGIK